MTVTIAWRGGDGNNPINPSGANNTVGYFGDNFGQSIAIGEYQDSTHVTTLTGSVDHGELTNNKFLSSTIVETDGVSGLISAMTVEDATLRIHFNNSTGPVQLQNTEFIAYDGSDINNDPSGVTVQAAELSTTTSGVLDPVDASGVNANGDTAWTEIAGTTVLDLIEHTFSDTDHYHYVIVSASPDSIGTKPWKLRYQTEFL